MTFRGRENDDGRTSVGGKSCRKRRFRRGLGRFLDGLERAIAWRFRSYKRAVAGCPKSMTLTGRFRPLLHKRETSHGTAQGVARDLAGVDRSGGTLRGSLRERQAPERGAPRGAFNATRAAEAAGYAWPSRQGARLTAHPVMAWHIAVRFTLRYEAAKNPDGSLKMNPKGRKCM